jgi:hypothetical protein
MGNHRRSSGARRTEQHSHSNSFVVVGRISMECKHGFEVIRCTVASMLLEELHLAFVLPCLLKRGVRPRIAPLAGRFTPLTRVRTIFVGFEFADHMHMVRNTGACDQNRVRMLNECCKRRRSNAEGNAGRKPPCFQSPAVKLQYERVAKAARKFRLEYPNDTRPATTGR